MLPSASKKLLIAVLLLIGLASFASEAAAQDSSDVRPNIVWVVAEDMSPHLGVYGDSLVQTPNIDRLAAEGVRFDRAFVTSPICSPARSALVSGMYQTTLGAHHHRSQRTSGKGGGNEGYYASYEVPEGITLIPELFQEAGYYTTLGGPQRSDGAKPGLAKSDYNFIWDADVYDGDDWSGRQPGQPFFAQVHLQGGKNRDADVPNPVSPADVTLPPYYPDHPVLREDWANYLNAIQHMDREVGQVLDRLEGEGIADSTVVIFMSDHGISHLRGKQFLYDEGIHVPLVVRFPDGQRAGDVREDLVEHIDVAAASLAMAGIPIPDYVQGLDVFADDYVPRRYVFAARDRGDETVDVIRAVRSGRYKYIRNYYADRPHAQPNRYKDGKEIVQTMRALHEAGELNALQDRPFAPTRPPEELYDLESDPHETQNLVGLPEHGRTLENLRAIHVEWIEATRDMGLIPEPILEDLGQKYGSKYAAMKQIDHAALIDSIRATIALGERGEGAVSALAEKLKSKKPSVRYWAAIGLARMGEAAGAAHEALRTALEDPSAAVRIAAARALGLTGKGEAAVPVLVEELENENLIAGMYAALALEDLGDDAEAARAAFEQAAEGPYEFTRRVANRVLGGME